MNAFERNITIIKANSGLMWGRFFIPVIALFYIASQVSLAQFTIIMSVFALATLVLEIPSGVIADLVGKKNTLILSRLMYLIEIYLIAFHNGFWVFLIAKIISGVGVSLSSGTSQAILYDSLKRLNKTSEHKKISGIVMMIANISMAVVFIVGSYLFSINNKLPAIASLPIVFIGFVLTFFMKEPYPSGKSVDWKSYFAHFKSGLYYFWKHKRLRFLAFYSLPIITGTTIFLSMSSAYLEAVAIPIAIIGFVAAISALITAYTSKKAYILEEKLGEQKSLRIVEIGTVLGILIGGFLIPYIGVLAYFIIAFSVGFFQIIVNDYINKQVMSSHRATILSINNMFGNVGIFIIFPFIGHLSELKNIGFSYFVFVGIIVLYILTLHFYIRISRKAVSPV